MTIDSPVPTPERKLRVFILSPVSKGRCVDSFGRVVVDDISDISVLPSTTTDNPIHGHTRMGRFHSRHMVSSMVDQSFRFGLLERFDDVLDPLFCFLSARL